MTFDHPQKMRYLASMEYGIAAAWDVIQDSEQEVVMGMSFDLQKRVEICTNERNIKEQRTRGIFPELSLKHYFEK